MSKVLEIKEGQTIVEFDSFAASQWCTPSVLGCSACFSASQSGGSVILTISLNTPFGNWSKSFSFKNNVCFSFQPVPKVKVEVCISNFKADANQICFTLGGKVCLNVPFLGWKCTPNLSHQFCIPLPHMATHALVENDTIDDATFTNVLLLSQQLNGGKADGCNCH